MTSEQFQLEANNYAASSIQNMRENLAKLEHAQNCDDSATCEHAGSEDWHDEDEAQSAIDNDPLSIEVRSGWYSPSAEAVKPEEYNILLGTGGPAARIIGELEGDQPASARFEYQDWFQPWTTAHLSEDDQKTLLEYANRFYFGE